MRLSAGRFSITWAEGAGQTGNGWERNVSEKKEIPELKKELMNDDFYLYECNHVTSGEYGIQGVLPVGRYANILVCKHCWANLRDMFLADAFREMITYNPSEPLRAMLASLMNQQPESSMIVETATGEIIKRMNKDAA